MYQSPNNTTLFKEIVPTSYGYTIVEFPSKSLYSVFVTSVVVTVLAVFSTCLRVFSRVRTDAGLAGDDWAAIAAAVAVVLLGVPSYVSYYDGDSLSHDFVFFYNIVAPTLTVGLAAVITIGANSSLFFIKISILLLYKRVFPQRWIKLAVVVISILTTLWWISFTTISILLTAQLQKSYAQQTKRFNNGLSELKTATEVLLTADACLDITILLLPIPLVIKLNMSRTRKFKTILMFALGAWHLIMSALRSIIAFQFFNSRDVTPGSLVTGLELNYGLNAVLSGLGLVLVNIPAIKPLTNIWVKENPKVRKMIPGFLFNRFGRRKTNHTAQPGASHVELQLEPLRQPRPQSSNQWSLEEVESPAIFKPLPALPTEDAKKAIFHVKDSTPC